MLSLEDIKNVSFRRAKFGGYRPEDVDAFIDDLQVSYERILDERAKTMDEMERLKSRLEKYQAEDGAIKDIILNAQKVAEKSLMHAESETQNMIKEASVSSEKMINEAKKEVKIQSEISRRIKEESSNLRKKLEEIYKNHMELINSIPNEVPAEYIEENDAKCDIDVEDEPRLTPEEKVNQIFQSASVDIFSNGEDDDKFKNLEFGDNYTANSEDDNSGVYNGIFNN